MYRGVDQEQLHQTQSLHQVLGLCVVVSDALRLQLQLVLLLLIDHSEVALYQTLDSSKSQQPLLASPFSVEDTEGRVALVKISAPQKPLQEAGTVK